MNPESRIPNPESRIPNPESKNLELITISFLVTFYNQKEFIRPALESILNIQIPEGFQREILIGDDGSTDGSHLILEEYLNQFPEIKLFSMPREKNKVYISEERASANRLNLLKHSRGKYFMVADGDDVYCSTDFLLEALPLLEQDSDLSLVLFLFDALLQNNAREQYSIPDLPKGKQSPQKYIHENYVHAAACVFRSPNEKQLEILCAMASFDDNHILLSFLTFGKMYFIPKVIYTYKLHGGVWSSYTEFEKNLLNALSFELLSFWFPKHEPDFKLRYYNELNFIWNNKKTYLNNLKEKAPFYLNLCRKKAPVGLVYDILRFDDLPPRRQKEIKIFFPSFPLKMKLKIRWVHFKVYLGKRFPHLKSQYKKWRKKITGR